MEKQAKTCQNQQNAKNSGEPAQHEPHSITSQRTDARFIYLYIYLYIYIDIDIDIDDCFLPCDLVELLQHAVAKGSPLKCESQGVLHVAACGSSFYGSVLCAFGLGMLDADGWF